MVVGQANSEVDINVDSEEDLETSETALEQSIYPKWLKQKGHFK